MNDFEKIYWNLRKKYSRPAGQWKLWCKRPKTLKQKEEVLMGAILTQRTNWKNVELSIKNLKRKKIDSLDAIYKLGTGRLETLIKPAGFYKTKSKYLFNLAQFIKKNYGNLKKMQAAETEKLREELLRLKGIGPETADSILLYGLDKPVFVIDEYTRKLVKKKKLARDLSYAHLQNLFMRNLRKDYCLYQDFHALIVIDGKLAGNKG